MQTLWNQAHAPLLVESFPKTPKTQSKASWFGGFHNYKTKQNNLFFLINRCWHENCDSKNIFLEWWIIFGHVILIKLLISYTDSITWVILFILAKMHPSNLFWTWLLLKHTSQSCWCYKRWHIKHLPLNFVLHNI